MRCPECKEALCLESKRRNERQIYACDNSLCPLFDILLYEKEWLFLIGKFEELEVLRQQQDWREPEGDVVTWPKLNAAEAANYDEARGQFHQDAPQGMQNRPFPVVVRELLKSCLAWEPQVRILGNVTANEALMVYGDSYASYYRNIELEQHNSNILDALEKLRAVAAPYLNSDVVHENVIEQADIAIAKARGWGSV